MMLPRRLLVLSLPVVGAATFAATLAPTETVRPIRFTVHEGSMLGFDVSHDGQSLVMDMLGQLWRLPINGGVARPITDAVRDSAEFLDPQFAPDGRSVMAHGEFRGQGAVLEVPIDSGQTRMIGPASQLDGKGFHSPSWSADGRRMVLARPNSGGAWAIVERDVASGTERVVPVTGTPDGPIEGPVYSSDGSSIYFTATAPGWRATFPAAGGIWRVPTQGGMAHAVTPASLRARAVAPSPDGQRIAYLVTDSTNAVQVWSQGVADSAGAPLTAERAVTPTRVRWLAGSATIVYGARGRLWRLDLASRAVREIPFTATVEFSRREAKLPAIHFPKPGTEVATSGTSGFALSPDGRSVAMIALSRLWIAPAVPGASARDIARVPAQSWAPEWSPDGRRITWWAGPIWEEHLFVTDTATRVTHRLITAPGNGRNATWSPDGRKIAFAWAIRDSIGRVVPRLRVADVADTSISDLAGARDLGPLGAPWPEAAPQWSPAGDAVLMLANVGSTNERGGSLRFLNGSPPRAIHGLPFDATWVRWLAGDTLVFVSEFAVWKAIFDAAAGRVHAPRRLNADAAGMLAASRNGAVVYLGVAGLQLLATDGGAVEVGRPVRYRIPAAPSLLIRNVRIADGTGAPVSPLRDVVIREGRIARIAPAGSGRAPAGVRVLDGGGRVAMPGLIDLHAHHQTAAALRGQLHYGVTSMRRLGPPLAGGLDAVASGEWMGPRLIESSTNGLLTDAPPLWRNNGSAGPAREDPDRLGRTVAFMTGAARVGWMKIHSTFGWATMDRAVALAHERSTRVTGHCAYPLTLLAAGIDSKEHLGWQCSIHDSEVWYDDLVQLYAHAAVPIVPTRALFSNTFRLNGAPAPPPTEVAGLFGPTELAGVSRSLNWYSVLTPGAAADLRNVTDAIDKLWRAGVVLGAGSDFERPDGIHYELEALVEASLTPLQAIKAATANAAHIIGASGDIGRIAPGLLADVVLLDADPTADIRNTRRVWAVIQGGRVVDREALVRAGWDPLPGR